MVSGTLKKWLDFISVPHEVFIYGSSKYFHPFRNFFSRRSVIHQPGDQLVKMDSMGMKPNSQWRGIPFNSCSVLSTLVIEWKLLASPKDTEELATAFRSSWRRTGRKVFSHCPLRIVESDQ